MVRKYKKRLGMHAFGFVILQEKDFKRHQYYLSLLDGGTKDYEEFEDEDEVTW